MTANRAGDRRPRDRSNSLRGKENICDGWRASLETKSDDVNVGSSRSRWPNLRRFDGSWMTIFRSFAVVRKYKYEIVRARCSFFFFIIEKMSYAPYCVSFANCWPISSRFFSARIYLSVSVFYFIILFCSQRYRISWLPTFKILVK